VPERSQTSNEAPEKDAEFWLEQQETPVVLRSLTIAFRRSTP